MGLIAIIHVPDHTADDAEHILNSGAAINYLDDHGDLVGLFVYPTRQDLVDHPNCSINGKAAWSRSPMGFMRCAVCGKRNKRARRFLIEALFDFLGANLYPEAPVAFRTPEGFGPPPR